MSIVKVKKVRPTQKKRKPCGCRKKKALKKMAKPAVEQIKRKIFL